MATVARRRPAPRGEGRLAEDVQRRLDAELDAIEGWAAERWRVVDVLAATGTAGPGDFVRVVRTATVHISPPGAGNVGRCLLGKLSASGGTLTLRGIDGATIDGAETAATSAGWEAIRLVAVSATAWETW